MQADEQVCAPEPQRYAQIINIRVGNNSPVILTASSPPGPIAVSGTARSWSWTSPRVWGVVAGVAGVVSAILAWLALR